MGYHCSDLATDVILHPYKTEGGREFGVHGFARRLNTLEHCIRRVFEEIPLCEVNPNRAKLEDATAFIQAFMINASGAIDNLLHIWINERSIRGQSGAVLTGASVSLRSRIIRQSLPQDFASEVQEAEEWQDYLKGYRDALAHRIPLYIVPKQMSYDEGDKYRELDEMCGDAIRQRNYAELNRLHSEQDALGKFTPMIMHSVAEQAVPMLFHAQMISDMATVATLGRKLFSGLQLSHSV